MRAISFEGHRFRRREPEKERAGDTRERRATAFAEQPMPDDMRARLAAGDLVLDIGASNGNHSVFLAGVCGREAVALAPGRPLRAIKIDVETLEVTQLDAVAGLLEPLGDLVVGYFNRVPTLLFPPHDELAERPQDGGADRQLGRSIIRFIEAAADERRLFKEKLRRLRADPGYRLGRRLRRLLRWR